MLLVDRVGRYWTLVSDDLKVRGVISLHVPIHGAVQTKWESRGMCAYPPCPRVTCIALYGSVMPRRIKHGRDVGDRDSVTVWLDGGQSAACTRTRHEGITKLPARTKQWRVPGACRSPLARRIDDHIRHLRTCVLGLIPGAATLLKGRAIDIHRRTGWRNAVRDRAYCRSGHGNPSGHNGCRGNWVIPSSPVIVNVHIDVSIYIDILVDVRVTINVLIDIRSAINVLVWVPSAIHISIHATGAIDIRAAAAAATCCSLVGQNSE